MQQLVADVLERFGYGGMALLIAVENLFPPIPSEVILTFGGFLTTCTALSVMGVVFYATVGAVAGALALYGVGRALNAQRLDRLLAGRAGRLLGFKPGDAARAAAWFEQKGAGSVFFCRCVPILRSLISIPAGMAKMDLYRFFLYTAAGSLVWNTLLVGLGAAAGAGWARVAQRFEAAGSLLRWGLAGVLALAAVLWLAKKRKRGGGRP